MNDSHTEWQKSSYSTGGANCVEVGWRKSSYSGGSTGNCLEARWRKSPYSNDTGGHCVEVAEAPEQVLVRDTQHRSLGHLDFPSREWAAFLMAAKAAEV